MFNKKRCAKCKWRGYLGSYAIRGSEEAHGRHVICDYAKYHNCTCLYSAGREVKDRRGDDPNHCKLFETGPRPDGYNKVVITPPANPDEYFD